MAKVYADLIRKGKKTIDDVPIKIREQVRQILIDFDCGGEFNRNMMEKRNA